MKHPMLRLVPGILLLIGAGFPRPQPVRAADMLAGHWHLMFYGKCTLTAANLQACHDLQSPGDFAVASVPGATLTVLGIGEYVSDARGHYRVHFTTMISATTPNAGRTSLCDNHTVFDTQFSGRCTEEGWGHGHIAKGGTGMLDFWEDDTTGFWHGNPTARFYESTTTDTLNPACEGTLTTNKLMRLLGYHSVPVGISARLTITHRK